MWTGVSGLLAHGDKMNIIGNNIANVNTVGFKAQRMDFADFIYQDTFTNSGTGQVGRGVSVGAIMNDFSQGPYESTTDPTDLSIAGRGFFQVKKPGTNEAYYTRAGNFRFDKDLFLCDPNGMALQGWKIDNSGGVQQAVGGMSNQNNANKSSILGSGVPQDVQFDNMTVMPQATTNMQFQVNLSQNGSDKMRDNSNPFASLFKLWNGTQPPPSPNTPAIPKDGFEYQSTMGVFDEAGVEHKVTVYYDKVSPDDYTGGEGDIWEYIVTMDPSEDARQFVDENGILRKMNETDAGGLLMSGTMHFNKAGTMINQTAYTLGGKQDPTTNPDSFADVPDPSDPTGTKMLKVIKLDPNDLNNWYPAAVSNSGLPIMNANFTGVLDAQTTNSPSGNKYNIEIDFGAKISNFSMPWSSSDSLGSLGATPYVANSSYSPTNPANGPQFFMLNPSYSASAAPGTFESLKYLLKDVPKYERDAGGNILNTAGGRYDADMYANLSKQAADAKKAYEDAKNAIVKGGGTIDGGGNVTWPPQLDPAVRAILENDMNVAHTANNAALTALNTARTADTAAAQNVTATTAALASAQRALTTNSGLLNTAVTTNTAFITAFPAPSAMPAALSALLQADPAATFNADGTIAASTADAATQLAFTTALGTPAAASGTAINALLGAIAPQLTTQGTAIGTRNTAQGAKDAADAAKLLTFAEVGRRQTDQNATLAVFNTAKTALEAGGGSFENGVVKWPWPTPAEQNQMVTTLLNTQAEDLRLSAAAADAAPQPSTTTGSWNYNDPAFDFSTPPGIFPPGYTEDATAYYASLTKGLTETKIPLDKYAAGTAADANDLGTINKPVIIDARACTSLAGANATRGNSQNGYTFGDMTSYRVDADGVLSGIYSNGITLPLWQIVLYDFSSTQALRREGGNLFSETRESGQPQSGPAGVSGLGKIQGSSLEQSNVDMSREFVLMITTQRGFQSNSKIITTTDTMLETVIQMKR